MVSPINRVSVHQIYFYGGSTIDPDFVQDEQFVQNNLSKSLLNIMFRLGVNAVKKIMYQIEILPTTQTSILPCRGTDIVVKTLVSEAQKFVAVFNHTSLEFERFPNDFDDSHFQNYSRCNSTTSTMKTDL